MNMITKALLLSAAACYSADVSATATATASVEETSPQEEQAVAEESSQEVEEDVVEEGETKEGETKEGETKEGETEEAEEDKTEEVVQLKPELDEASTERKESEVHKLEFKNRRDDRLYNEYLDLEQGDLTDDDFNTEKDKLEASYLSGYKPSLWSDYSYTNLENLEHQGADLTKNYINIPVNLDFTLNDEYTQGQMDQHYDDIRSVFNVLRERTCINFTEVNDIKILKEEDSLQQYIQFTNDEKRGCDEIIGKKDNDLERPQIQAFSEVCLQGKGTMAHYVMHQLGFDNEHQRPDVAKNKMIINENIKEGGEVALKIPKLYGRLGMNDLKNELDSASFLTGVEYDQESVMHWSSSFIANHGNLLFSHMRLGQANVYSDLDILKINRLYNCDKPIEQDEQENDQCHYIIHNNVLGLKIPENCLYSGEESISGNAHIYVSAKDGFKSKVELTYELEAPVVESDEAPVESDDQEGEKSEDDENLESEDAEPVDDAEKEAESEVEAEGEVEVEAEVEAEIEAEAEPEAEERRLEQDYDLLMKKMKKEEAAAEEPAVEGDEPVVIESEDASEEGESEEGEADELLSADADDEAVEGEVEAEEEVVEVEALEEVIFDEENTQEKFESEKGANFETLELDNTLNCTLALLAIGSEESTKIVCGNKSQDEYESECNKDMKISYRLLDQSIDTLKVVQPTLLVNVTYEECSEGAAALVSDEQSNSNSTSLISSIIALTLF